MHDATIVFVYDDTSSEYCLTIYGYNTNISAYDTTIYVYIISSHATRISV